MSRNRDILKELNALEQISGDYLKIINSDQYRIGTNILKMKEVIKTMNFSKMRGFLKYRKSQREIAKISNVVHKEVKYFTGSVCLNKGCVYTCITEGYDIPSDPVYCNDTVDFRMFSDDPDSGSQIWKVTNISSLNMDFRGNLANRYCKLNPHKILNLDDYKYAIYIDGNIQIVSDVSCLYMAAYKSPIGIAMHRHWARDCAYLEAKACLLTGKGNACKIRAQVQKYKDEGFPNNYGLCEASIIVIDLTNPVSSKIMNAWWEELVRSKSGRDQIAFPYVLWKNNYAINDVGWLGDNLFFNPKFRNTDFGRHNR